MGTEFLITGASGQLGRVLLELLGKRAVGTDLPELDITDSKSVKDAVERVNPKWIINCAALTDVDMCQRKPELAMSVHRDGVANLVRTGRRLLTISTDHVFTGKKGQKEPFLEGDETAPCNLYGESKLLGESEALVDPRNIVIRTSWLYSAASGMIPLLWKALSESGEVPGVIDQVSCLTYAPDLAEAVIDIIRLGGSGLYHLVNSPGVTPAEVALRLSEFAGGNVKDITWADLELDAPRPVYSELATSRGTDMPAVWNAIERWRMRNV